MSQNKNFLKSVKSYRKQHKLTQEDVANSMCMSKNGYANLERGESEWTLTRMNQFAKVMNIAVADLFHQSKGNSIYLYSENSTHSSNYYGNSDGSLSGKVESLQMQFSLQEQLLK